jgi:hypothetical protein
MAASSHPDWYRNLGATPQVAVELITDANVVERFDGTAVTAQGPGHRISACRFVPGNDEPVAGTRRTTRCEPR